MMDLLAAALNAFIVGGVLLSVVFILSFPLILLALLFKVHTTKTVRDEPSVREQVLLAQIDYDQKWKRK